MPKRRPPYGVPHWVENQLSSAVISAWVGYGGEIGMLPLSVSRCTRVASLMTPCWVLNELWQPSQ